MRGKVPFQRKERVLFVRFPPQLRGVLSSGNIWGCRGGFDWRRRRHRPLDPQAQVGLRAGDAPAREADSCSGCRLHKKWASHQDGGRYRVWSVRFSCPSERFLPCSLGCRDQTDAVCTTFNLQAFFTELIIPITGVWRDLIGYECGFYCVRPMTKVGYGMFPALRKSYHSNFF